METKKNPLVDIFRYSTITFQICLIIVMGFTLMAFEWKKSESNNNLIDFSEVNILRNDTELDKIEEIMLKTDLDVE
ncbi:MAG: hypothetical protein EAY69_03780 [Cytophagales bacterium]|nr:MAG: hypothetical protein EAY69_03780 [Cytophagales bacterium]